MANQKGIIHLTGEIDGIGFYQRDGKYFARKSNPVDGKRIKNDPAFARTRENMAEFSSTVKSGKLLRDTMRPMLASVKDNTIQNRLHKVLSQVKNMDAVGARGDRNVAIGLSSPAAKQALRGFNFNSGAVLHSVLYKQYAVDVSTGIITIPGVLPTDDIAFPSGATHVGISGGWAKIDFASGETDITFTNVENLPVSAPQTTLVLTPAAAPAIASGTDIFLLLVCFFQEVNGTQYVLKNGAFNVLSIVDVA